MKVVNFFGQPSAGKSTIAAGLFYKMKMNCLRVELVTEFAKDLVWADRKKCLTDQMYVISMQNHRLEVLRDQVDFVVTDSPILLGVVYAPEKYFPSFPKLVVEIFDSYDNVNFFVKRVVPYSSIGRRETEAQADEKGRQLVSLLEKHRVEYTSIEGNSSVLDSVYEKIVKDADE